MAFNINNFNSNLNEYGVAKASHFEVYFTFPEFLNFDTKLVMDNFTPHFGFRCETAELPGQSVATTENRIYGPQRKIAYGNIYTDMNFTLLCSTTLREKVFFDNWINKIVGVGDRQTSTYDVSYLADYKSDVIIKQYDEVGNPSYTVKLIDAFPTIVSPLSLNHGSQEVHKVNVSMTYYRWEFDQVWEDKKMEPREPSHSWGAWLGAFGTVAGAVSSRLPPGVAQAVGAATGIPSAVQNIGAFL